MRILIYILLWLSISNVFAHHAEHLGQIHFPTTGKAVAQADFEKGVMLLHNFQYDEARASFLRAEKLDPEFALAYWGEALTYNHTLWDEQNDTLAMRALNKYAANPAARQQKTRDVKERGLIAAVDVLYGKGDKSTRDKHYADAMRELYRQYPEDDELAIMYSLSLLGVSGDERDVKNYMQAAGVAEDIAERNHEHPGALHYALHAYDDPIHAPLGLRAARQYAKVAPSSAHALHMPSHIYFALGMWEDVKQSNQAAWEFGQQENPTSDVKAYTVHDLHALSWLVYAHLQQQHYAMAKQLTKTMEEIAVNANSPMAKWYYTETRAAYQSESNDVITPFAAMPLTNIELSAYASDIYSKVLVAKKRGTIAQMRQWLHELNQLPKKPSKNHDYFNSVTKSGILAVKIVGLQIEAHIAECQHQVQKAIQLLKQATALEEGMSFGYGPPIPVKPSYELLGEFLLKNKQYLAAYQQFIISLQRAPNRLLSMQGLADAKRHLLHFGVAVPQEITPYFHRLILPEYFH